MSKYNKIRGILKAQGGLQFGPFVSNNSLDYQGNHYIFKDAGEALPLPTAIDSKIQPLSVDLSKLPKTEDLDFDGFRLRMDKYLKSLKSNIFEKGIQGITDFGKKAGLEIGKFVEKNPLVVGSAIDILGNSFGNNVTNSQDVDKAFALGDFAGNLGMKINPSVGLGLKTLTAGMKTINNLTGSRTRKFTINQDVRKNQGASYTGSYAFMDKYALYADKEIGGFSFGLKNNIDNNLDISENILDKITKINNTNQDYLAMSGNDLNYLRYGFEQDGSYDQRYMRVAKYGAKLEGKINFIKERRNKINSIINLDSKEIEWLPTIVGEIESFKEGGIIESSEEWTPTIVIEEWEPTIIEYKDGCTLEVEELEPIIVELEESVEGFKQGGKTKEESDVPEIEETTLKNIIPEGALHKNKHHIEHTEGLTLKGIPVVDNDGKQQAEVECEEIIFTLEVTKALEERYHKYYSDELTLKEKDELAIEAGKLLVREILYNTDDRANLIEKCEKGGKL